MKVLIISNEQDIANPESDVYQRHRDYSRLVDKLYIHYYSGVINKTTVENMEVFSFGSRNLFRDLKELTKLIKEQNIDLIITPRPFYPGILALLLKLFTQKKILLSVYGSNIYNPVWVRESFRNLIFRFTLGPLIFMFIDYIQTDSHLDEVFLKDKFNKPVFFKPMIPANLDNFSFSRNINNNLRFNVLYIGRLVKQKNIDLLIKIIKTTIEKNKNIEFTIIGDGPECFKIDQLVQKFNINVHWFKQVNRQKIEEIYNASDMLLLCSKYEGFPRVFMESAMSGLPVVSSLVSGLEDIYIDGSSAFVISNVDENKFAEKILYLNNNRGEAFSMGQRARENFKRKYNKDTTRLLQKDIFYYINNDLNKKL